MKKTLFVSVLALVVFSNCSDIVFESPLPADTQAVSSIPDSFLGKYEHSDEAGIERTCTQIVQIAPQTWCFLEQRYVLNSMLDSTDTYLIQGDSLMQLENDTFVLAFRGHRTGDRFFANEIKQTTTLDFKKMTAQMSEFDSPAPMQVRKKEETYYVNLQLDAPNNWSVYSFQSIPEGIRFNKLNDLKSGALSKLPFKVKMQIQNETDTIRLANPTNAELARYERDTSLYETFHLVRVKE